LKRQVADSSPRGSRGDARRHVCRLATDSSLGFTEEMAAVLRRRMRLAVLILLVGFTFQSLRSFWLHGLTYSDRPAWIIVGDWEDVMLGIALALLWSRRTLSVTVLRVIELAVFGMLAAFFGWLQIDTYHERALPRAPAPGPDT